MKPTPAPAAARRTSFRPWHRYAAIVRAGTAASRPKRKRSNATSGTAPSKPRRTCPTDDRDCAEDGRCPECGNIGRVSPPDLLRGQTGVR